MIENPNIIIEKGIVSNLKNDNQIQQNGIDLTVGCIYKVKTNKACLLTEKTRVRPQSTPVKLITYKGEKVYKLEKGGLYEVLFEQDIKIPSDLSGTVVQRSSLNRMGTFITTGWWDSGFENKIGCFLRPSIDICIGEGARLAQIILFKSDSAKEYDGIYKK